MDEKLALGVCDWRPIRRPLELSQEVVHVVRLRLDLEFDKWTKLAELLSDDERLRAKRFAFDELRSRFITCRATLRQILADICGLAPSDVQFEYGTHGKPALAFDCLPSSIPRIEFSVSHSGQLALLAFALDVSVGIDVEEFNFRVKILDLATRFFAQAEVDELRSLPDQLQLPGFYRGWTCKEAYIKAMGRGMSLPLKSFAVAMNPTEPAALRWVEQNLDEPSRWTVTAIDVGWDYAAAAMVNQTDLKWKCWDWPGG